MIFLYHGYWYNQYILTALQQIKLQVKPKFTFERLAHTVLPFFSGNYKVCFSNSHVADTRGQIGFVEVFLICKSLWIKTKPLNATTIQSARHTVKENSSPLLG